MTRTDTNSLGIYIHVPFCKSKCPYCDFYSLPSLQYADAYTDAVINEIQTLKRSKALINTSDRMKPVTSIYFGGGTPSHLGDDRICAMLHAVKDNFSVKKDAEITVECNPSTENIQRFFTQVQKAGVNRISLGMQSCVDTERKALGRKADKSQILSAVQNAKSAGIHDISLDIMIGIPHQTLDSLKETLDFALQTRVGHLSVYMLKLEEGTYFYKNRHKLCLPDEDTVADMYLFVCDYLKQHGMRHYEISNFCFDNRFSRHNTRYWELGEYWGIGPGAHSFVNGKRFYFERDLNAFINGKAPVFDLPGGDAEEAFMLALRLDKGINLSHFCNRYSLQITEKTKCFIDLCIKNGIATLQQDVFCLTDKGMLLSNTVITELLLSFTPNNRT